MHLGSRSRALRLLAVTAFGGAIFAVGASSASAHVTIDGDEQPAGGFATLHFQVPNESDTASTVKVEIGFPADAVIPFVLPRAGGWKVTTERRPLATPVETEGGSISEVVSKVTFEGGAIAPGQFEIFDLEVGPLPDTPGVTLAFPAVQTYDDGDIVRWIDPVVEGQAEPEHPSPIVKLVAAEAPAADVGSDTKDDDSNVLAIVALVFGAVGTILGAGALLRSRRAG